MRKKTAISNETSLVFFRRWEAAQVPGVREGLQPELQPHHAQQETHGIQAVRLWPVREGFPEKSGPEKTQGDAARTQVITLSSSAVKSCTLNVLRL